MFPNYDPFTTDLHLAQESLLILDFIQDEFVRNPNHFLFKKSDALLSATISSHRTSVIINLHKVFDELPQVYSISHVTAWLYNNKSEFTKEKLVARKGLAYAESTGYEGISEEEFQKLFDIRRDLQKAYNRNVKDLRHQAFAHRSVDFSTVKGATYQLMQDLADGAAGIYEDIWQAYHNGRNFSLQKQDYVYSARISKSLEKYFRQYAESSMDE